jgi:hypothetical protein
MPRGGVGRLCRKLTQNKDFRTVLACQFIPWYRAAMQNSKSVSELLARGGNRLASLKLRAAERSLVLEHVRGALTPKLAQAVISAGIEQGRLTIGVAGAVWASRIRYCTDVIRKRVSKSVGSDILAVRIRVVQAPP